MLNTLICCKENELYEKVKSIYKNVYECFITTMPWIIIMIKIRKRGSKAGEII